MKNQGYRLFLHNDQRMSGKGHKKNLICFRQTQDVNLYTG